MIIYCMTTADIQYLYVAFKNIIVISSTNNTQAHFESLIFAVVYNMLKFYFNFIRGIIEKSSTK